MTVINEPTSNNITEEVGNSDVLMMKKIRSEKNHMSFSDRYKELDDIDSLCFVRGYN